MGNCALFYPSNRSVSSIIKVIFDIIKKIDIYPYIKLINTAMKLIICSNTKYLAIHVVDGNFFSFFLYACTIFKILIFLVLKKY